MGITMSEIIITDNKIYDGKFVVGSFDSKYLYLKLTSKLGDKALSINLDKEDAIKIIKEAMFHFGLTGGDL